MLTARWIVLFLALIGCGADGPDSGPSFTETRISVGEAAASPLVLDANRDGVPDLVVAATGEGSIALLLGEGDGAFRDGGRVPAGENPVHLAAGDLDEDGRTDLAVANHETDYVTLLFGTPDGFGRSDRSRLRVGVSPHPHAVAPRTSTATATSTCWWTIAPPRRSGSSAGGGMAPSGKGRRSPWAATRTAAWRWAT